MSKLDNLEVECPGCGRRAWQDVWASVNVNVSPELKLALLERKLNRFSCPGCGELFLGEWPLLYHDMGKKLMVWLRPDGDEPEGPDITSFIDAVGTPYRYRIVTTFNDLVEKVLIGEDGLDDRVIELAKLGLWKVQLGNGTRPSHVFYSGILQPAGEPKQIEFTVFGGEDDYLCTVPFDLSYDRLSQSLEPHWPTDKSASKWLQVNRSFANRVAEMFS